MLQSFPDAKIWWQYSGEISFFNAMSWKRFFKTRVLLFHQKAIFFGFYYSFYKSKCLEFFQFFPSFLFLCQVMKIWLNFLFNGTGKIVFGNFTKVIFFLYALNFLCKHNFIFSIANQSFLNVNWTTGNSCILCSHVVKKR